MEWETIESVPEIIENILFFGKKGIYYEGEPYIFYTNVIEGKFTHWMKIELPEIPEIVEIKPCPFCGNDKIEFYSEGPGGYLVCSNCGARVGIDMGLFTDYNRHYPYEPDDLTIRPLLNKWNTRPKIMETTSLDMDTEMKHVDKEIKQ
jgi:hypothetical protein